MGKDGTHKRSHGDLLQLPPGRSFDFDIDPRLVCRARSGRTRNRCEESVRLAWFRRRVRDGNGHLVDALHRLARVQPFHHQRLPLADRGSFSTLRDFALRRDAVRAEPPAHESALAGLGSVAMGGGIVAMHYTGMAAMRLPAECNYSPISGGRRVGGCNHPGDADLRTGRRSNLLDLPFQLRFCKS
jgi:hypothetical protein